MEHLTSSPWATLCRGGCTHLEFCSSLYLSTTRYLVRFAWTTGQEFLKTTFKELHELGFPEPGAFGCHPEGVCCEQWLCTKWTLVRLYQPQGYNNVEQLNTKGDSATLSSVEQGWKCLMGYCYWPKIWAGDGWADEAIGLSPSGFLASNRMGLPWSGRYSTLFLFVYICDWEMVLKESWAVCLGARAVLFILWSSKLKLGLLFTTIGIVLLILKCLISRFPKCCSLCLIAVSPQTLPIGSFSPLSKSLAPSP